MGRAPFEPSVRQVTVLAMLAVVILCIAALIVLALVPGDESLRTVVVAVVSGGIATIQQLGRAPNPAAVETSKT